MRTLGKKDFLIEGYLAKTATSSDMANDDDEGKRAVWHSSMIQRRRRRMRRRRRKWGAGSG